MKKKEHIKRTSAGMTALAIACLLAACSAEGTQPDTADTSAQQTAQSTSDTALSTEQVQETTLLAAEDEENDEVLSANIFLSDEGITVEGTGAESSGSVLTVTQAGLYHIEGSLSDGQIIVETDKESDVTLELDGVDITCTTSCALWVKSGDKVTIKVKNGSTNTLSDGESYSDTSEDAPDACIYSKDDLVIKGSGTLVVNGNYSGGIHSTDDVKINNGSIAVNSAGDGIKGKDSVQISGGIVNVTSGGDGIVSTNDEEEGTGIVDISDGSVTIVSGGGSANAAAKAPSGNQPGGGMQPGGMGGRGGRNRQTTDESQPVVSTENARPPMGAQDGSMPGMGDMPDMGERPDMGEAPSFGGGFFGGWENSDLDDDEDHVSAKGIKAAQAVNISGGTLSIDSADDAIHSDGTVSVTGGTFVINTGDDALHADTSLTLADGEGTVEKSSEGLEAPVMEIRGGTWDVYSTDDGINLSGGALSGFGNEFAADDSLSLLISGGMVHVSSEGDGIDSNGSITMTGGTFYVDGPVNSGNGALDYNGTFDISGGTLIAVGSSGMAQGLSGSSSQNALSVALSSQQAAGTELSIRDAGGNAVISYTPEKTYSFVTVSTPDMTDGTYALYIGDTQVVSTDVSGVVNIDDSGNAISANGMGGMGGRGGRMGGHTAQS
ncbi:MAG: carbohydrate-binding domain-containing protein [Oscillospiraceae bacterium]|nr:carbohydrate-binding domain-containing protein [Oscillospiraceae bacterium]